MSVQQSHKPPRPARPRFAFYDFDASLARLNLIHATFFLLGNLGAWAERITYLLGLIGKVPGLYLAERADQRAFNQALSTALRGVSRDRLAVVGKEYCTRVMVPNLCAHAVALIERNRELGIEPVLVTGAPDFLVAPLALQLDISAYAANHLTFRGDVATGKLREPIMAGENKALWCARFASEHQASLSDCWGYADSYHDLPFLNALGHPVAVNPDARLQAAASGRQWPILRFSANNHGTGRA